MLVCSYMAPKIHVSGPRKIGRVLYATKDETILRSATCGLDEQRFEGSLAIASIGPEIGQCGEPAVRRGRPVMIGINAAI